LELSFVAIMLEYGPNQKGLKYLSMDGHIWILYIYLFIYP